MTQDFSVSVLLVLVFVAANLPFLGHRLFFVVRLARPKTVTISLFELIVWQSIVWLVGVFFESALGQIAAQGWQFFVAFGFLCLTCAFPGFVWRFFWISSTTQSSG